MHKALHSLMGLVFIMCMTQPVFAKGEKAVWDALQQVKVNFQNDFYNLAKERWPEMESLLLTHRNLQLTLIERRKAIYDYWYHHKPERLPKGGDINDHLNFTWTQEEEIEFVSKIPSYLDLEAKIEYLKQKNNEDPKWMEAKTRFQELQSDPAYLKLIKQMTATLIAGEKALISNADVSHSSRGHDAE